MDKKIKMMLLILGGTAVAGGTVYWLFFRKEKSDQYGNTFFGKKKGALKGGVVLTETAEKEGVTQPNWNNPFDMNYKTIVERWVHPKQVRALAETQTVAFAKKVYGAKGGFWGDDKEEVIALIFGKQLQDKVQVAQLSAAFWALYQKDMWEFLRGFLSDKELENLVHKPVRLLPKYRLKD